MHSGSSTTSCVKAPICIRVGNKKWTTPSYSLTLVSAMSCITITLTLSVRHIFLISTTLSIIAAISSAASSFFRFTVGTNVAIITIAAAVSAHCSMTVARKTIGVLAVVSSSIVVAVAGAVSARCSMIVARTNIGVFAIRTNSTGIAGAFTLIVHCSITVARTNIGVFA